jgi:kynurenine formamidase
MRRLLALAACLAVGIAVGAFGGAFAGDGGGDQGSFGSPGELVDLSYPFNEDTIYWPTATEFTLTQVAEGETEGGYYYAANDFAAAEHGGTHLDAPVHFARGGSTADEVPLERLVGDAVVVDVSRRALADRDYLITKADLRNWERRNGRISPGSIVLLRTGFGQYRAVKAVGIDTASIDYGQSTDFLSHRVLGAADTPVFENVANMDRLPSRGFSVVALPMKIEGGSGGPLRIIAVLRH